MHTHFPRTMYTQCSAVHQAGASVAPQFRLQRQAPHHAKPGALRRHNAPRPAPAGVNQCVYNCIIGRRAASGLEHARVQARGARVCERESSVRKVLAQRACSVAKLRRAHAMHGHMPIQLPGLPKLWCALACVRWEGVRKAISAHISCCPARSKHSTLGLRHPASLTMHAVSEECIGFARSAAEAEVKHGVSMAYPPRPP